MKIAFEMHPVLSTEKTGVGFYTENLIRHTIKENPKNEFIAEYFLFKNKKNTRAMVREYSGMLPYECCFPRFIYRMVSILIPLPYRWFFRNDASVRHFFNYIVPPFAGGKNVVTIHDLGFRRFPETVALRTRWLLRASLRRSIARADVILAISEFTRQEILHFYRCPPEKVQVLYAGVDQEKYHAHISLAEIARVKNKYGIDGSYILYLGTLEPRKNIERLLCAYAQFKQRHADAPALVIAGRKGWLYDGIFQRVVTCGIDLHVHFTGYADDRDKPGLLAGAMFFCFPSLYEGFGMPPLESMACGTPVLASNAASLPEVIKDAGILVDPFSITDIADGMELLYTDDKLRAELSQKGIARAAEFNWDQLSKKLFTIYKSLEEI